MPFPWALCLYVVSSSTVIWVNKILLVPGTSVLDLMWYQNLFGALCLTVMRVKPTRPILPALKVAALKIGDIGANLLVLGAMDVAMSTALRRMSIILTFVGERLWQNKLHSLGTQTGIYILTLGTVVAVAADRASTWSAYGYLGLSNVFTVVNNIYTSTFVTAQVDDKAVLSLQYVTSLCALTLCTVVICVRGLTLALSWGIVASSLLGLLVNLSLLWAYQRHSTLTVSVIGATRSIVLSWCSIVGWLGQDYVFTWPNFVGLQLASLGCVVYLWAKR